MKAIVINEYGGPEKLREQDVPDPVPAQTEVLIRVAYAGVNPVDWKIREGWLKDRMPNKFPIILGWDAAGEVAGMGSKTAGFKTGDRVFTYCRKPVIQMGTYAEFVAVESAHVALAPDIGLREASTLPLAALTAWQALFDILRLAPGEKIYIDAGAGGVGGFAVQLAHWKGATVLASASSKNHGYVRALGAEKVIDYNQENCVETIRRSFPEGVDAVFDLMGGDTYTQSLHALKKGGRIVSALVNPEAMENLPKDVHASYVFVSPHGEQLARIQELMDHGFMKPLSVKEYGLTDAAAAHRDVQTHHVRGKIALKVG